MVRPSDVPIPQEPMSPYPINTEFCDIVCGFGRGSSELGIPTANVPIDQLPSIVEKLPLGVYFGFCRVAKVDSECTRVVKRKDGRSVDYNFGATLNNKDLETWPVVLSIGLNPFYHNKAKTVELHIMHKFSDDFYGAKVKFNILGFIRPELDYTTKEALIKDINTDIEIAKKTLNTPPYSEYSHL